MLAAVVYLSDLYLLFCLLTKVCYTFVGVYYIVLGYKN